MEVGSFSSSCPSLPFCEKRKFFGGDTKNFSEDEEKRKTGFLDAGKGLERGSISFSKRSSVSVGAIAPPDSEKVKFFGCRTGRTFEIFSAVKLS